MEYAITCIVQYIILKGASTLNNEFKCVIRNRKEDQIHHFKVLDLENAEKVQRFHESFPQYQRTPLAELKGLADALGVETIFVKDESYRFGLNAFKVLGGSYALGQIIAERLNLPSDQIDYETIVSEKTKAQLGDLTFVTATDGNHGRGIAWTAAALNQKSVVYMPKGSSLERLHNIQKTGAFAEITDMNYDDAVRLSEQMAEKHGWILVQDTAWEGYDKIPSWIMQGYMTMAHEADQQMKASKKDKPTHLFLQAGVGSMAAAVQGYFTNLYGAERPITIIVEPNKADCLYRTALANDGKLHHVTEEMDTIMAGLACGEPSTIGWEILKDTVDAFVSCTDNVAAKGMRILGNPAGTDQRVVSGESGAVGVGLLAELMTKPELAGIRDQLELNKNSRVLFFSTEGDTDQTSYRCIVWDGAYPTF
jgi:diaminopropionate ammonia-lyase